MGALKAARGRESQPLVGLRHVAHGFLWEATGPSGMAQSRDAVNIEVPVVLRDLIAHHRLHPRQALHEVIEDAVLHWIEAGGWAPHGKAPVDWP